MLRAEALDVSYGEGLALRGADLEVPSGQVVCLMGRNGVGKTTLLRTLMGALRPRAGRVWLHGQDITGWPSYRRARAGMGYVPQGRGIFPHLSVAENLQMGRDALAGGTRRTAADPLELFPGLRALLGRPAGSLSGGQQQQLAIARALCGQPSWLLLDEPTEGVQPSIVAEIEAVIAELRRQGRVGILLVEQYLEFALRLGDRYCLMERGSVVDEGRVADLNEARAREVLAL